jgi:autotransporter-associated beta strand protein
MKSSPTTIQERILRKVIALCGVAALTTALSSMAQQTVFYDTFGQSTLNGGPTTNMIPGGTPTASHTSYEIISGKNATASTNNPGNLLITTAGTSSGNTEAQALFTQYPVTLGTNGDYIELDYTFTDTTDIYNGLCGNSVGLYCGLFNSGGVPPNPGTLLWNAGLGTGTTDDSGGTENWLGYNAGMLNGLTASAFSSISTRAAATTINNTDQQLLYGAPSVSGSAHSTSIGAFPYPNLTIGSQYTVQFRITLSAPGSLTVSNAMYAGAGIAGAMIFSNVVTYTDTSFLTTNFDGLAVGYRDGDSASPHIAWTNDITGITVVAGLAAQAGPYFLVTSSGNGCGGAVSVGLSGSVTTNVYFLYTNGVYGGQAPVPGTGSAISFGLQTTVANYTVMASNTVTGSMGPMLGSANIYFGLPSIVSEPVSVVCATNLPVKFSVGASGNELNYQWYRNGVALTNGGDISGVTKSNLVISPAQAADAAGVGNGYYAVASDACGNSVTSAPNVSLTLVPGNQLVWQGDNNGGAWDLTNTLNFTNSAGISQVFSNGDIVTFNDSSLNQSVIINATNLIPTVTRVIGTMSYTFSGSGQLTGFGQLADGSSGTLTIGNANSYTGGTVVSNGATMTLGTGSGTIGSVGGTVTVNAGGTLNYSYAGSGTAETLYEALAGSGTVNYADLNNYVMATLPQQVSSNFNGTINIAAYTCVHASDLNSGYPLGNGSTINVPDGGQAWLDRAATAYNNTMNIGGTGWLGTQPNYGALRVYSITINGAINLTDNARIGGSSSGPTIQSVISGPYQLEIFGPTNTFLATLGPTNGAPQAYDATLITSGSIICANSNAISTGPLTLDVGGDLRLNGNNITVSNLSSINSGQVVLTAGATVRNSNSTNSATLTAGTDNTSTEFDGTFLDGGSAPLGLAKVGSGTLTLTGVNTNTGAVVVSGGTLLLDEPASFGNAALLSVASGATFDVTGRGDQTLTLNSGQKLTGSGTVNGNVSALAGSTINPGDTIGTLSVSGNVTLAGTVLMELNRASAPATNDLLAASGTLTAGGVLTVTNLGPALHAGDSFQLFSTSVSGFTKVNLPTNDLPNNVKYTWNNTLGSNGKITVAGVISLVNTNPPRFQVAVSGNTLSLGWPTNAGWTLLTNSVGLAAANQWFPYPNSANLTNVNLTLNPAKTNVFFRMVYPYP